MTKKHRTHIINDAVPDGDVKNPKFLTKQEFGRRVYRLMISKGWRQSDLAREAGLLRDSISTYVRGVTFPSPMNLEKLAKALGVDAETLLPNHTYGAIEEDDPDFELKISPGNANKAWVKLNRLVSTATAVKIAELINADVTEKNEATDRS